MFGCLNVLLMTLFSLQQTSHGVFYHVEVGLAWNFDAGVCVGLGASFCKKVLSREGFVNGRLAITKTWTKHSEHTDTAVVTLTSDYTTSDSSSLAGNKSDMFLTPALNVKFSKSALIGFDKDACTGTYQEIVTWSLDSASNVPVSDHHLFFIISLLSLYYYDRYSRGALQMTSKTWCYRSSITFLKLSKVSSKPVST
jgi:hypothetical protein